MRPATRPSCTRCATPKAPLGKTALAESVARYLFKLMAYKDEYEVARLHSDTAFLERVNAMFEGDFTLNYHLAPPLLAKRNAKGELQKQKYGPAMLTGFRCWRNSRACAAGAGCLRSQRRAPHRARADWRIPGQHRRGAGRAHGRQACAGARDCPPAGKDQGLRPRQGAQPGGRTPAVAGPDAAVAGAAQRHPGVSRRRVVRSAGRAACGAPHRPRRVRVRAIGRRWQCLVRS